MSFGPSRFGLRLAFWYASLFIASALAIVILTYYLTADALAARDRQILRSKAGEYAAAYARGGFPALTRTVQAEQAVEPERLFVRVLDRGVEAIVLSQPRGWDPSHIELESVRLGDGTMVQVGKSSEARSDLLARLRFALAIVTLIIILVGLAGGRVATRSALIPIRNLTEAVRRIIDTGRADVRVPVGLEGSSSAGPGDWTASPAPSAHTAAGLPAGGLQPGHDAVDELAVLFNRMLDRIERLVDAMRGSLDNVSHDLRTPLARLRSTAEFALTGPADIDRYRDALTTCVDETDRTLLMLDTLMDISEAESGAMHLRREPVDVRAVASRAIDLYRDVAEHEGVWLGLTGEPLDGSDSIVVSGDRTRLEQVAANLIDNAVKYTPVGGRVELHLRREQDDAVLEVRDTGAGIPAHDVPRIWERLFRGDRSRGERGLGLGLSLVRAIVEAHNGSVAVTSEAGQGSTFTIRLPLWSQSRQGGETGAAERAPAT